MTYRERDALGLWLTIFLLSCLFAQPLVELAVALIAVVLARGVNDWFDARMGS